MTLFLQDPDLLSRFRAGEREALARVYWHYVAKVEDLVYLTLRSSDRASGVVADLVQEVFVKVFAARARRAYDGVRPFAPYVLTVTRNVLTDRGRLARREV